MKLRHIISAIAAVATTAFIGFVAWYTLNLRSVDKQDTQAVSFVLKQGTDADQLAAELEEAQLIRSKAAFVIYVTLRGYRSELQAGAYEISPSESVVDIAAKIAQGRVSVNKVILPEGITILKISELLQEKGVSRVEFLAALKEKYEYDFVKAIPEGVGLEGYLFPDTYEIIKPVRLRAIIQLMLENFAKKAQEASLAKGFAYQGLTFHQGVTLASIVEREVKTDEDRGMVAGLYLNRLKAGIPLQADPTALYGAEIVGKDLEPAAAVAFDSLYNTYKIKGLPPGPIGNPGLPSMKAVAAPRTHDFIFFISGKDGKTYYAKTLQEHEANIKKYLQ